MSELQDKQILIGISGGIAAYKAAELVRVLISQGARVRVCMTLAACEFITPLTLQALSTNPVHTSLLDSEAEAAMEHIELARWADLIMVAPASADLIARLAHGLANDLLTTVCLATEAPIHLAPAMNRSMWKNSATQANVDTLKQRGFQLHGPAEGEQACGETGKGRMLEATQLADIIRDSQSISVLKSPLQHKKILVTAGPTREAIDPVRFISNRSSGKMGYAIATAARDLGADVTLVSGPVALDAPAGVTRVVVESAREMHEKTLQLAASADIFIASAAVSDYSPKQVRQHKIKKSSHDLTLELAYNPDILLDTTSQNPGLFSVGFAAETEDLIAHAEQKLLRKKLDMIIANPVGKQQGFEQDTNQVEILWNGGQLSLPLQDKNKLAQEIMEIIAKHYANHPVLV